MRRMKKMTKRSKEKKKKSFVWIIIYMCVGAVIGGIIGFVTNGNVDLIHMLLRYMPLLI